MRAETQRRLGCLRVIICTRRTPLNALLCRSLILLLAAGRVLKHEEPAIVLTDESSGRSRSAPALD